MAVGVIADFKTERVQLGHFHPTHIVVRMIVGPTTAVDKERRRKLMLL